MSRRKEPVTLVKDGMSCYFESVTAASKFLNTRLDHLSRRFSDGYKCFGWQVKKGFVEPEPIREVIIQREIVYEQLKPRLRVNGLLTPNKTEHEYYHYQAKKGEKHEHI